MLRAGPNSLPRPARSALNQEVRQGSCEWLRHSWDAGSESSLVTFFAFAVCGDADNKSSGQSQRNTIPTGWCFLHLPAGQRLEQGTSEARETCRGHVLVPACVWRPGWAASEPRRPLQKITPSQQGGVFLHLPGRRRCAHRHAGSTKASYFYDAFVLLGRWSKERYSIICYTFSFSLQPLCQWLHRR